MHHFQLILIFLLVEFYYATLFIILREIWTFINFKMYLINCFIFLELIYLRFWGNFTIIYFSEDFDVNFYIFRLIMPYVMILHVLSISMKYFHEYSVLDIPSHDHVTCEANMWKNLLFIDNFVPYSERVRFTWKYSL